MHTILTLILLTTLTLPALAQQSDSAEQSEGAFVHTVYFWMNNPDNEAERQKLHEGLKMIKEIEHIQQGYIGVPAPTEREVIDSSYDFAITFIFEDMEAEQAYQTHPTHLKFVEDYSHLWDRVVVYDATSPE